MDIGNDHAAFRAPSGSTERPRRKWTIVQLPACRSEVALAAMSPTLFDYLFPRRSLTGREGEWITEGERWLLRSFPRIEEANELKRQGIRALDRLRAGSSYASCPLLRKAVCTLKYRRVPALAGDLGQILLSAVSTTRESIVAQKCFCPTICCCATVPVVVPVPLHWTRRFQRGFNQSALLAAVIARERGLPCALLLRRIRPTGFQSHRTREMRLRAVSGAFRAVAPVPLRVVLIDDIATTGATLDACAVALKSAGAEWVEGWVVARG
jgi:predicted amidophosphoribosyltransferase